MFSDVGASLVYMNSHAQPPNPLSVAPKKHIVALNKLERLRDLPLHFQHMATSRSKTLSKTDLLSWRNDAIIRAFERNIATSDIAHIFDVTRCQLQRLQVQWLSSLLSATMCFLGATLRGLGEAKPP